MFDLSDLEEVTKNIKAEIEKGITDIAYGLWFKDMNVLKLTEFSIYLSVDTEMQQKTIESKYFPLIRDAVKAACKLENIDIVIYSAQQQSTIVPNARIYSGKQSMIQTFSGNSGNGNNAPAFNFEFPPEAGVDEDSEYYNIPEVSAELSKSGKFDEAEKSENFESDDRRRHNADAADGNAQAELEPEKISPAQTPEQNPGETGQPVQNEIPEFALGVQPSNRNPAANYVNTPGNNHTDESVIKFRLEYTFDNFVVGASNRYTYAACTAVVQNPALKYNPLFIHGPPGIGKTHLLYAIANKSAERFGNSRVIYVKGEDFTNQLIDSLAEKKPGAFREKYRNCDVLLIDDIQFVAGKSATQEELFHTFNALYEAGKQIILASDKPPREIKTLEDRLTSRFEWGLITEIQPPDLELRIAILKRKADDMNIKIPNEVLLYLGENVTSNIRQIEGAIKKLNAYADMNGGGITLELAKTSISDVLSGNEPINVTVERTLNIISRKYDVSPSELKSRKRTKEVVLARHIAIYVLRKTTDMSLISIGKSVSRDHSTVLSALDSIENELKANQELSRSINDIIRICKGAQYAQ